MPHKFNADRRDKIPKQKHRVTNWAEYNESLRRRGDLTVWISEEALALWSAPRRTKPGGQPGYSDLAIETCLTLGMVFRQPLRQTQGLMCSIAKLLGVEIAVPSFSTLSRRGNGLTLRVQPQANGKAGIQLVVAPPGFAHSPQVEPGVEPDNMSNDLGRKPMAFVADCLCLHWHRLRRDQ